MFFLSFFTSLRFETKAARSKLLKLTIVIRIQKAEAEISSELITLDESEDSVLTSNPALLGVMALGAAAFAF